MTDVRCPRSVFVGDVNVTITDTPDNLILVDVHHIAKSNAAIPGLESSAVQEDGVIKVRRHQGYMYFTWGAQGLRRQRMKPWKPQVLTTWNDTFTEDMEGAPVNTLVKDPRIPTHHCFVAVF